MVDLRCECCHQRKPDVKHYTTVAGKPKRIFLCDLCRKLLPK